MTSVGDDESVSLRLGKYRFRVLDTDRTASDTVTVIHEEHRRQCGWREVGTRHIERSEVQLAVGLDEL